MSYDSSLVSLSTHFIRIDIGTATRIGNGNVHIAGTRAGEDVEEKRIHKEGLTYNRSQRVHFSEVSANDDQY